MNMAYVQTFDNT